MRKLDNTAEFPGWKIERPRELSIFIAYSNDKKKGTYTSFVIRLRMLNIWPRGEHVFVKIKCDDIVWCVGIACRQNTRMLDLELLGRKLKLIVGLD